MVPRCKSIDLPEKHIEKISHFEARECISDLISEFECELSH